MKNFLKKILAIKENNTITKDIWSSGINYELQFWHHVVETQGDRWPEQYSFLLNPNSELQTYISKFLGYPRPISILDVGSGPLTTVGKKWGHYTVKITACDALADYYRELPVKPLVPVKAIDSEKIKDFFSKNSFDVAHARNTLDHSYDPLKAIKNLISVTKKNGIIILLHSAYEATKENFEGFHQWDFYIDSGRFYMRSGGKEIDVYEIIGHRIQVLETLNYDQVWVVWRKK